MWSGYVGCLGKSTLDKLEGEWENRAALWRCRGPGGFHRLQNGWGVARRGPWWVRLPYASAWIVFAMGMRLSLIPWFCRICKTMLPISDCKTMLPSKYSKIVDICRVTE